MADIDKDLPNVEQTLNVPSPEEIEVAEQEKQQEVDEQGNPVDITENEDGSVDINYGDEQNLPPPTDHNANLADYLDETESGKLSAELIEEQGIFNPLAIQSIKQELFSNNPEDAQATVWALIVFNSWWKKYIKD